MSLRSKVAFELATIAVLTVIFLVFFHRLLLPLAVSHAALGSAFYYGLFGHDLTSEWRSILP